MKRILFILFYLSLFVVKAQNGFTTYTTNLTITGSLKFQTGLVIDNSGNKWIGFRTVGGVSNAGLVKYDNTNWTLYNKTSSPSLPTNNITAVAKDNSGNIWLGSDSGLVKFDGISFTTYSTAQGLPMKYINCIDVVGNQIYVGTKKGLSRFDGISFTNYNTLNGKLPFDTITCVKAENSNVIWLGTRNNLVEFDINSTFTTTSYTINTITGNAGILNSIFVDSQSTKWLGTSNVGVLMQNGATFTNVNSLYTIPGIIPPKITDIALGLNNGVVFKCKHSLTSNCFGLIELAPNNKVYTYIKSINSYTNGGCGDNIENNGNDLVFTFGGPVSNYPSPNMLGSFNQSFYTQPFGMLGGNNVKSLDINQVLAGVTNRNYMHGFDYNKPGYVVPKGSGKCITSGTALWIAGLDMANQLHGGAQMYGGIYRDDFWPGPLDTLNATIDTATSYAYDKTWKVNYNDINTFIAAYNSGSVVATPDMLSWPAHGTGNNSRNLAPFVDSNGDGIYNPNDGDYPKIKGDQALYFIYNDMLSVHASSFTPMGIEVQGMAYAYGCAGVLSGRNELAYTTFYDYKIINRSGNNYHDVYVGLWSDVKIGNEGDDFIGCDVAGNYGYVYNADSIDEDGYNQSQLGYGNISPSNGTIVLKGPSANSLDGIDNNNDGFIDEIGEDCKMSKFISYYECESAVPIPVNMPFSPNQKEGYYTYLQGQWKDSTSIQCGNRGYGTGNANTNWMYPGDINNTGLNTDPNNTCGYWIEPSNDCMYKNYIISSGPFTLNAGQMQEVEYAFVTSFDSSSTTNSNLLSVAKLKTDMQKVTAFYNQVNKPNCLEAITLGITEVAKQNDFSLYPNPAKSIIAIASTINGVVRLNYEIVDVLGKIVMASENTGSGKFSVNINDLNSGIYFLRLQVNNSMVVKKFVKE